MKKNGDIVWYFAPGPKPGLPSIARAPAIVTDDSGGDASLGLTIFQTIGESYQGSVSNDPADPRHWTERS